MVSSANQFKKILFLIPYFGKWPEWIEFYIESCKANQTIDWLFFTDNTEPHNFATNVSFEKMSFSSYKKFVSDKLKISFDPDSPYKLCDLKIALGYIHRENLSGYDFFGFGDIDVIYGNIRKFYDKNVLNHDVISSHFDRISGHMALFKNTDMMRNAFRRIKNWQYYLEDKRHFGIDESKFSKVFLKKKKFPPFLRKIIGFFNKYQRNCYFKEQYTTILSPKLWLDGSSKHPEEWIWKNGKLTNTQDGKRDFLYLHFMNWKSNVWLPKDIRHLPSAWQIQKNIIHMDWREAKKGFKITRCGFEPLSDY